MGREIILLRTSERTSFKKCRFAWDIAYNQHLKPKTSAPALRFGSLIHKALELRYPPGRKRGPHPATSFEQLYEEELDAATQFGFRDEDGTWHEAGELGVAMLNHFVDTFGNEDHVEVIASEMAFQVPILRRPKYEIVYVGIMDLTWKDRRDGKIWIRDWKTCKSIPDGRHLTLDEQPGSYWAYGPDFLRSQGILKGKQNPEGIDFFFMRKAKQDARPRNADGLCLNKDGSVSKQQPAPYFKNHPTRRGEAEKDSLRKRVLAEAKEHMLAREGKLEIYKNPGQINCGGCGYRDACELHEAGQDYEAFMAQTMTAWDPYAEHELYDRS